ncbi:hypothetical protein FHX42_004474 [Saccharopolyspora lacisalsi]|uniref:Peptidase M41 domain-containing protein n=1 Tax=Halosaccharopolyspora lacisalsi TaxID=1000566 RepID=A0A839E1Y8_9PSEU|nr:M50 family metallopeptidase [Halosaccharopolyspora lacisalsi]MBA8827090.1 hypothetical protein [Halosaccharopolyspora lacisalsi]
MIGPSLTEHDIAARSDAFEHARVCVHEAGHAVYALARGWDVDAIVISRDEQGHHQGDTTVSCVGRPSPHHRTLQALAGPAAEYQWLLSLGVARQDAERYVAALSPADESGVLEHLHRARVRDRAHAWHKALSWIDRHWSHVLQYADLVTGTCDGDTAESAPPAPTEQPPQPTATTPAPPRPTAMPPSPTTTTGGTVSSIEELRSELVQLVDGNRELISQLWRINEEMDTNTARLAQLAQGTSSPDLDQAHAAMGGIPTAIADVITRLGEATHGAEEYATRL